MPGLRGTPEVITTTSELALAAKSVGADADRRAPPILQIGHDW